MGYAAGTIICCFIILPIVGLCCIGAGVGVGAYFVNKRQNKIKEDRRKQNLLFQSRLQQQQGYKPPHVQPGTDTAPTTAEVVPPSEPASAV